MRTIILKAAAVVLLPICVAGTVAPQKLAKLCCGLPCPKTVCPVK
jgi:hypothetical protein